MVENMSYFSPVNINPPQKYFIFGKQGTRQLAEKNKLTLLGEIPINEHVCESGDAGSPIILQKDTAIAKAMMDFCRNTAQAVSIRNAHQSETKKVEIK
jgi:ATP-binding protein involved in chromosome partitioning